MYTSEFKELIIRHMLGIADEVEESRLHELLDSDPSLRQMANEFCEQESFADKFEEYKNIDNNIAFNKFEKIVNQETFVDKKLVSTSRWWNRTSVRVASILLPLIILGGLALYHFSLSDHAEDTAMTDPPYRSVPPSPENRLLKSEEEDHLLIGFDKTKELHAELKPASTPRASYSTISLEDGTRITLNSCSEIAYPKHFSSTTREVTLKGEAYFEIAKNENKPFIVHVEGVDIKQYGTRFNVNAYDENNIKVTLTRGSIGITPKGKKEQMLKPNQSALITNSGVKIFSDNVILATEWREGLYHFSSISGKEIADVLGRMYAQTDTLVVEPGTRFTGVINRTDNLKDVAYALNCIGNSKPFEQNKNSQDCRKRCVTLNLKGVDGKTFFETLHKQTGISYVCNTNAISLLADISVKAQNESLETVLNRVLSPSKFQYSLRGNVLIIKDGK